VKPFITESYPVHFPRPVISGGGTKWFPNNRLFMASNLPTRWIDRSFKDYCGVGLFIVRCHVNRLLSFGPHEKGHLEERCRDPKKCSGMACKMQLMILVCARACERNAFACWGHVKGRANDCLYKKTNVTQNIPLSFCLFFLS
jgi:hypothetical protein